MTCAAPSPRLRDESGFTLVELLVAMVVSVVILFAVLTTLDNFSHNAARQTRVTDANDQVRRAMDRVVSDLRQAATIAYADADDLVYTVSDTPTRYERLCVDAGNRLWRASGTSAITGGVACPTAGSSKITPLVVANTSSQPLFAYNDDTAPDKVRSVSLRVSLNAGNAGRTDISTLRASAFVRSRGEKQLLAGDSSISTTCNSTTRVPTLNLAASFGTATVKYTDTEGNALGQGSAGANVTLSSATPTATTVIATITSSTGLVSQLVKTLECTS